MAIQQILHACSGREMIRLLYKFIMHWQHIIFKTPWIAHLCAWGPSLFNQLWNLFPACQQYTPQKLLIDTTLTSSSSFSNHQLSSEYQLFNMLLCYYIMIYGVFRYVSSFLFHLFLTVGDVFNLLIQKFHYLM